MHLVVTAHLQVGVNVNLDASFLERDYGVKVANTVDLRTHARECWVETPSRSLAGMVSALVGKELPKDPTVRLSRWSSAILTDQQVKIGRSLRGTRVRIICWSVLSLLDCLRHARDFSIRWCVIDAYITWPMKHAVVTAGELCVPGCLRVCSRLWGD